MTECTIDTIEFSPLGRKKVQADFSGGEITSDAGVLLLREIDKQLGLTQKVDKVIPDPRDPNRTTHDQLSLLRQRIYGVCLGYEDLNDHQTMRHDSAMQTAVEVEEALGSQSTLCRLENRISKQVAWAIHEVMIETFIDSFSAAPEELILDFDATDDRVHGEQEGRFYHGYYGHYCFLPLYVFCQDHLLVSYLRPSNNDGAKHTWAILSLLVKRLRQEWPDVRIIFRGDSGFCRWKIFRWCDKNNVDYVVGLAKNSRLKALIKDEMAAAETAYSETGEKQKSYKDLYYGANSWDKNRRVIAKIEHLSKGANPRFVVTSVDDDAQHLYEKIYCARGDMENRIKEQQLGLFADRTSCHYWWPNQFRLLLSSLAYILISHLRRQTLAGTELAKAQVNTIRLKLLKIGAAIVVNTRRVRVYLSEHYPYQKLFEQVVAQLVPG